MQNLILIILLIVIIILIYLLNIILKLYSKQDEIKKDVNDENYKTIGDLKYTLNDNMLRSFNDLSIRIAKIVESQKNNEVLIKSFTDVSNKLTRIDEAQKNIDKLSHNILDFKNILTDKKTRGIFGETQLNQVLYTVFGDKGSFYEIQYKMNENKIVDAILFTPEPLGLLPIDSKFPLDNFIKLENGEDTKLAFIKNVKKHIFDISEKYVKTQGLNQAIMFIPAESIYTYILSDCSEVIEYAYNNKVWLASPMSLMAILTTIQMVMINQKRNEISEKLYKELQDLSPEFIRYEERWNNLVKNLEKINKDIKEINITTKKIGDKFERIKNAE